MRPHDWNTRIVRVSAGMFVLALCWVAIAQEPARHGQGVTELNPCGAAAREMRDLWQSINRRLAQAEVARPARAAA